MSAAPVLGPPRGRKDYWVGRFEPTAVCMFESAFPDFRYRVEDVIAEGEKVAVRDVFEGTHQGDFMGIPATGNRVTMEAIHSFASRAAGWPSTGWLARMMRQLGVIP